MNLRLTNLKIENFKGIKDLMIDFTNVKTIKGANATGKTTIFDAVTWLLFNKNSLGVEKFDLRPLDENGKQIDFVEIKVEASFENDNGERFSLEKKQKQNWVKHTGEEKAVFSGNVNEYSVNGFPKSEKDYKAFIAEIIPEETFKLLSNPCYFTSLAWKKQREILMNFASTESDLDLAKRIGGFDDLISELEFAPTTEDIKNKWAKAKKELDTKTKELPTRIDEVSRGKVDYDLAELELQKAELERRVNSTKTDNTAEIDTLKSDILNLKLKLSDIRNNANRENDVKRAELKATIAETNADILALSNEKNTFSAKIKSNNSFIDMATKQKDEYGKKYFEIKAEELNPSATVCPTCKQTLPAEKIETIKSDFEISKKKRMDDLVGLGNRTKADIDRLMAENAELEKKIAALGSTEILEKKKAEFTKQLETIPTEIDMNTISEYVETLNIISSKETMLQTLENASKENVLANSNDVAELAIVKGKIAEMLNNDKIDARIEELKAEQREVAQKTATCEKMLYLLDNFIRAKLDAISASVNANFELVNFKLFNVLLNGNTEETCEMTVNGVPFSTLNNGAKIVGGLDIIRTLSKHYDKSVFAFVDNSESVNEFNLPTMDCQLIRLVVTDDKELVVE